jgi:hypothetical protein
VSNNQPSPSLYTAYTQREPQQINKWKIAHYNKCYEKKKEQTNKGMVYDDQGLLTEEVMKI